MPGKALCPILGIPMICRVYERCVQARVLDAVLVATDDDRIRQAVESCGGQVVMTRAEHPSGTDRIAEAVQSVPGDIVVNIQGDQPFVDPATIDECVQPLLRDPRCDMTTVMFPITQEADLSDTGVVKVVTDCNGDALYFSRSLIPFPHKSVAHAVYEHMGLYAYRRDFLLKLSALPPTLLEQVESLEQLRVLEHGYRIRVVESQCADTALSGFSVDTPADLERAENMLRERALA